MIAQHEILERAESHQHHICSDHSLFSFHAEVHKYERKEGSQFCLICSTFYAIKIYCNYFSQIHYSGMT